MNKAEKETLLRRTAPSRQKQAQEYLQGERAGKVAGGGDLLRAASPLGEAVSGPDH